MQGGNGTRYALDCCDTCDHSLQANSDRTTEGGEKTLIGEQASAWPKKKEKTE